MESSKPRQEVCKSAGFLRKGIRKTKALLPLAILNSMSQEPKSRIHLLYSMDHRGKISKATVHLTPRISRLRAGPFPPLTLGLLTLQRGDPSEQRRLQPELSACGGCQHLLFCLGRVVSLRRQILTTYAASKKSQPSIVMYAESSVWSLLRYWKDGILGSKVLNYM